MQEFDELIFKFMNLDESQKKKSLVTLLSQNIQNISNITKNDKLNIDMIRTSIVDELKINDDDDCLTYIYILVRQLEDLTAKYIIFKNNK